jgi:retinol dehydrogenase-12
MDFTAKEDSLDVLFNNAGIIAPQSDQKTKQCYEMNLGVNTIAPFLFARLLTAILVRTAKTSSPGSVRVV